MLTSTRPPCHHNLASNVASSAVTKCALINGDSTALLDSFSNVCMGKHSTGVANSLEIKAEFEVKITVVARGVKWPAVTIPPAVSPGGKCQIFVCFCQFWAWKSYRTPAATNHALLSDVEELWGGTRSQTHKPEGVLSKTILVCKCQQARTLIRLIIAMSLVPVIPGVRTRGLSVYVTSRWARQNRYNLTYLVVLLTQTGNYSQQQQP